MREGGGDEKLFQYSKYWSIYLSVCVCLGRVPIPCVQAQRRRGHCASSFPLRQGLSLNLGLTLCQLSWKAASSSNSAPSTHLSAGVIGICGDVLFVRWVLGSELGSRDFRSNALNC